MMIKGHGMFGAHGEGGLLTTQTPFSKNCIMLQSNFKFTKPTTQN
jgi:hypothetical protein